MARTTPALRDRSALSWCLPAVLAVACGGGTAPVVPPDGGSQATDGGPPLVTAAGTPIGSAVTQAMDANGGIASEPQTGAGVRAPAGVFSSATQVTVQPVTNPLESGSGFGIAVSTDQPLQEPLIVKMPYGAEVTDPASLRLGVRADDGSWRILSPMRLDTTARTIEAALPPGAQASGARSSRVDATAAPTLNLANVMKFLGCQMVPPSKHLLPSKTVDLMPWCWVEELAEVPCPVQSCAVGAPDSCFETVCLDKLTNKYPLTNQKAGFTRTWGVEAAGTLQPKSPAGGTYTAPDKVPDNNPVLVYLRSVNDAHPTQVVMPVAKIYVEPDHYHVTVAVAVGRTPVCAIAGADSVSDGFSFDLSGAGEDVGTSFSNQASSMTNPLCADGSKPTLLGTYDYVSASRADNLDGPGLDGSVNHHVTVWTSQSQSPPCACGQISVPGYGASAAAPGLEFAFADSDFLHGPSQTLAPINEGSVVFTVTVEQK